MAVYGYARVSTDGQSLSAQLTELKTAKCEKIFQEKISGARADRKQLTRLMGVLAKGDVLVVTRLDRLARSTRDLLNLLGTIAEKAAGFKSLRDTWADTTTAHGRLMLTVLGGLGDDNHSITLTPRNWSIVKRGRPLRIRAPGFSEEGFQWEYWNFAGGLDGDLVVEWGEDGGVGFDGKLHHATIEETNPPSPKRSTKR